VTSTVTEDAVNFMWLELTGRCQLACVQCYADSGPTADHGSMATVEWEGAIDQAAALGVTDVCMIGGEPTTHPDFARLLRYALAAGLRVEVFTNLYRVPDPLWDLFALPGVTLATSYYSDDPAEHDAITERTGSYVRTRANIAQATARGIPIRVGLIALADHQRTDHARRELVALGVPEEAIGFDRLRAFGRGARGLPDEGDTCGGCGHGRAALLPDGSVVPCVFTRTSTAGNVKDQPLDQVLADERFAVQVARLDSLRATHITAGQPGLNYQPDRQSPQPSPPPPPGCVPNMCNPQCGPSCGPSCTPSCWPKGSGPCTPRGGCVPNYH
jgi:MoaA/NifB/PqqE/SkfB family radical SAM enzyme